MQWTSAPLLTNILIRWSFLSNWLSIFGTLMKQHIYHFIHYFMPLFVSVFAVDVCPSLDQYTHQVELSTRLAIFGTVVKVSCFTGFTFTPGQQHVWLECEEFGVWNDTVQPCIGTSFSVITLPETSPTMPNSAKIL